MIPLKHYGKCEVLGKIANMEPLYDEPMHFDPDLLPATSVAVGHQGLWDYGIKVAWAPKKYAKQTPTLEAGMYGFKGEEELLGVRSYLYGHGKYQLIPVSNFGRYCVPEFPHSSATFNILSGFHILASPKVLQGAFGNNTCPMWCSQPCPMLANRHLTGLTWFPIALYYIK